MLCNCPFTTEKTGGDCGTTNKGYFYIGNVSNFPATFMKVLTFSGGQGANNYTKTINPVAVNIGLRKNFCEKIKKINNLSKTM